MRPEATVEERVKHAFEAGRRTAFIAAVEECQAYHRSLPLEGGRLALAQGEAAQQIAMRIGQRAKQ